MTSLLIRFKTADTFKNLIFTIKDVIDKANLKCTKDGIVLQAMDGALVALVDLAIEKTSLKKYVCEQAMDYGLNIDQLSKILKACSKNDKLTISSHKSQDHLEIKIEGNAKIATYKLSLLDIEQDTISFPDVDFQGIATVLSTQFNKICSSLSIMAEKEDAIIISMKPEGLSFESSNGVMCTGQMEIITREMYESSKDEMEDEGERKSEDEEEVDETQFSKIDLTEDVVKATFSLKYLTIFSKAFSLSKNVTFKLFGELPIMIEYIIDDFGYLRFYLAQRQTDVSE
jgi:proliferating cell nuclear antigen